MMIEQHRDSVDETAKVVDDYVKKRRDQGRH